MKSISICTLVLLFLVPVAEAKIGGGDITFAMRGAGKVLYSHDFHVGKLGMTCTACHYGIFSREANSDKDKTTMAGMQAGKSCGACHNGLKAFTVTQNCGRCHRAGN